MPIRPVRTVSTAALVIASLLALSACGEAIRNLRGTSDEFDGAWVGQIQVVTRTPVCTLSRGGIRATIRGGVIDGKVRQPTGTAEFGAYILESGDLANGIIDSQFEKDTAEVQGTFSGTEGSGRWKSKECSGNWTLRKIR